MIIIIIYVFESFKKHISALIDTLDVRSYSAGLLTDG